MKIGGTNVYGIMMWNHHVGPGCGIVIPHSANRLDWLRHSNLCISQPIIILIPLSWWLLYTVVTRYLSFTEISYK